MARTDIKRIRLVIDVDIDTRKQVERFAAERRIHLSEAYRMLIEWGLEAC